MSEQARPVGQPKVRAEGLGRGAFYRTCRMLHAYLSACGFLALMFFSATGVLLNHPEWFENYRPAQRTVAFALAPATLAAAKAKPDPGRALGAAIAAELPVRGAYASSDIEKDDALIRFEGPKGDTDVDLDLATGHGSAKVESADLVSIMQDLHRGKNVGSAWRLVIDLSGYLMLAISLIGYVLFFSLRFRLKTSLALTAASLLVLLAVAIWLVP